MVKPNKSFWLGRKVIVTGDTGFKGSWLCLWLLHLGAEVYGFSSSSCDSPKLLSSDLTLATSSDPFITGSYHTFTSDIRSSESVASYFRSVQPEVVFHLAAQPIVKDSYKNPLYTWETNLLGSLHILEAAKQLNHHVSIVMITTDKVYLNKNWDFAYRENDELGGHDPYSASKAAAELAIKSWSLSFCGTDSHQKHNLAIATARAGNVIGGGDWSNHRLIPDCIRSLSSNMPIEVRMPNAVRPWQHVLEPLLGYIILAEQLSQGLGYLSPYNGAYNFGPEIGSNQSVSSLVTEALKSWPGTWIDTSSAHQIHEAERLHLNIDKAYSSLNWRPKWNFKTTIDKTIMWYYDFHRGADPLALCIKNLSEYIDSI